MKILVTPTSLKSTSRSPALEKLRQFADELVFSPQEKPLEEDRLIPLLAGCDGYVAGLDFITKKALEAADKLRVISRYGVGYERVDMEAARSRNITVCNTPGANAQAVADLTFALILAAARRVPALDRETRAGRWPRSTGVEIYGKTLGVLGLGAIGRAVAKRAQGFSMRVLAYDPFLDRVYAAANAIEAAPLDVVLKEADVLCLHLPLNGETRGIISGAALDKMKKGAILVNTARGGLLDEEAAYRALKDGRLGGLGLDAFEEEPPKKSPLFELDNVVLTPHTAAHTAEATENMANMAVDNLIAVLSGRECPFVVR